MVEKVETQPNLDTLEPSTSADLIKLIRKLRWIGLEEEARQLQVVLSRLPPEESAVAPSIQAD